MEGWVPTTLFCGLPDTPPGVRPAASSAFVAWLTVSPLTLGTVVVGGPVDTVTVTAEPKGAAAPLAGVVEITSPAATVVDVALACVAVSPTAWRAAWAWTKLYVLGMLGTVAGE